MGYEIRRLTSDLIFVRWNSIATEEEGFHYVNELRHIMEESPHKLYFISDLRKGYIENVNVLHRLGALTKSEQFGGGTAFSHQFSASLFVGVFARLARRFSRTDQFYNTFSEAIAFLEKLKPGVTQGIDWQAILNAPISIPPQSQAKESSQG
ncbi:MAG TPA: hypothetical protein PLD47_16220 [Aggregatilineales bacterium]|nr:hypothetical protein [Anaerolineales bacterium]HRE49273.1 hypothetical protein [Aggregatilineales bacterium]